MSYAKYIQMALFVLLYINEGYINSAIIGSVEIIDCVINHPSIWAEKGVYNWLLANPILFKEPIENVRGKLSFWDYEFSSD